MDKIALNPIENRILKFEFPLRSIYGKDRWDIRDGTANRCGWVVIRID